MALGVDLRAIGAARAAIERSRPTDLMWRVAGTALLLFAMPASTSAQDITRSCFPGFCVEAVPAFTVMGRNPTRGMYILKVSRTQSTVYLRAGKEPEFPHCSSTCRVEEGEGEKRAIHTMTGQPLARLIGPLTPCGGGEAFYVNVFVYNPEANPDWFSIVRECE